MIKLHTKWLKNAQEAVSIPKNLVVEISPLFAMDAETFRDKFVPPCTYSITALCGIIIH